MVLMLVMLSSCTKKSYNANYKLPEMPTAGKKVAAELDKVCDDQKCSNLHLWLRDLYLFKVEYEVIRENSAQSVKTSLINNVFFDKWL